MRAAERRRLEAERDGEVLHTTSCDSITQVRSRHFSCALLVLGTRAETAAG